MQFANLYCVSFIVYTFTYATPIRGHGMDSFEKNAVKIRRLALSDVDIVISFDWAKIPDKEMVSSQRGGRFDASFIAEFHGILVGFVLSRIIYVGRPMTGICQLHLIAVRPEYQRHGIGAMLLDRLAVYCKELGIQTMRTIVHKDDAELLKYFRDVGFNPSKILNLDRPIG
jgi:ribosomal protein S18 acetylase RimI-like enzyme